MRLQGRVKFPTGGKVRKPKGMTRCNSGTDSKVWMREDADMLFCRLKIFVSSGFFYF